MDALSTIRTRPQSEQADPRQVPNAAGGYGFEVADDVRVHRFLTLGSYGGTFYATELELTRDNADVIVRAATERGTWLVDRIVEISVAGRAPRQNPALFALAATAGLADDDGRKAALNALPLVCRTGTHLLTFARYVEQFRGWGRGLRRAVSRWYIEPDLDDVAYQVCKYRARNGWSHRDLLRLAHPKTVSEGHRALIDWIVHGVVTVGPALVYAFERAQKATNPAIWVDLIDLYPLSWEMLPDAALSEPEVWRALIAKGMPQTALMRQLPRLTNLGILGGATLHLVTDQLCDSERLRRGRVHPVNILVAMRTYASGHGVRGGKSWEPVRQVVDALDAAYYAAYEHVEPANKRTLVALDVSGSMGSPISGMPLTCREAAAALALVTLATEPSVDVVGFTGPSAGLGYGGYRSTPAISPLSLSSRQRLDDVVRSISNLPFGVTDCALPMLWAQSRSKEYDTIVIITDNETWAGSIHPHEALLRYRQASGIDTRLIVVGMTATKISIADPTDPGSLDVAGFDSAVPQLIADFSRRAV